VKKKLTLLSKLLLLFVMTIACKQEVKEKEAEQTPATKTTEETVEDVYDVAVHYTKQEVDIEMRDGIKLHTTIYAPKDTSKSYPIVMQRRGISSCIRMYAVDG